jgi:hypothetical protein
LGSKILDILDAKLKNQVIGLQLATEIKLYPEISVTTRSWNIKLVNDNRGWIPRLIELNGQTLDLISRHHFQLFVIDFNSFGINHLSLLGCTDHEGPV